MSESTIRSERMYTGKIIALDVDQVRYPDGSTGTAEMVRHPGAVAIIPFLSDPTGADPQLLLLRQFRYAAEEYLIEVPAGRLEENESPEAAAARELQEETGCVAEQFDLLCSVYTTPGFTDERIHIYMATGLTLGESAPEPDEFLDVVTVTLSTALRMIQQSEIRDAKTIVAILYAAGFRAGY